ncbi:hypothetical protein EMIHUDRAFT_202161 [Emiliania huxleyi CCMP1516]|uniref:RING-type domain-containing protein n=2 Tax=Emiliania huxleyi TaxID=2903 RepID=A0A0D3KF50_EMIH1|nr:hypothetical protein EMIHUDRAFT_202161 [Emiliania huxleyi CCMP1516]EOD34385.1 hypothetical protein EMIHUDRAFT_202161 [Emiliania huxleyi CCMP1516]|eukprot:XP_005786814.1 hypothetical protein EMIHUDRAFT_202161 [Emiliania huxleyi CCMP1516]
MGSEPVSHGADLPQRVDLLERLLGVPSEDGTLEARVRAIERLIGPEVAQLADGASTSVSATGQRPLPVIAPLAAVSLADADFDTGRRAVPESTMGGETTCIVCFARAKSHAAVPCGHVCACGPCSELMEECPYCREPAMMWMVPRHV